MSNDIFLITSVINTGKKEWSYTKVRSHFSKEERFQQTLESIQSIRTYHKQARIILVECSDIDESMIASLQDKVDYFIWCYEKEDVRKACLDSHKKGFGEVKQTILACNFIKEKDIPFDRFFKLSGRYSLTADFSIDRFPLHSYGFKMFNNSGSTVLYSVPYELFDNYRECLSHSDKYYQRYAPLGLENLLPQGCNPKENVPMLGVSGLVATCGPDGVPELYKA